MIDRRALLAVVVACASFALGACPSPAAAPTSESLDVGAMPDDVRPDYAVFAQRCSKCHSLARPLNSGIVDDEYWAMYVARMRRQPGSGITEDDARVILRFLHWYSAEQRLRRAAHEPDGAPIDGGP